LGRGTGDGELLCDFDGIAQQRGVEVHAEGLASTLMHLAADPTYRSYTAVANELERSAPEACMLPAIRVALLRNFTIDPLIPVIKGEIARAGFYPKLYLGDHDAIATDVFRSDSHLYRFQPDLILVAQWLETLAPALTTRFLSLSREQMENEIERVLSTCEEIVGALRKHSNAPILLNNFPLPSYAALGILDSQRECFQTHAFLKLNLELLRRSREWRDVYLVDYMSVMARIGSADAIDERYWQIGRAPLGRSLLVPLGQEYGKFFRALWGKVRKCLVLDCDNVLWGGIIGEDGLNGIRLASTYPGSCFLSFQQEILNLHDRGVILAMCSKNNEEDVLEVLRSHPEMLLRESNFATWQINWNDKVTNLMRIAQELNIGLDSLVFADDSQFECDMVRERLPQVAVLQLSSDPSGFRCLLRAGGYFDTLTFSAEDRERNRMYRTEDQRRQLHAASSSFEEYLARLEMVAEIGLADESTVPRISQLTQKTNQFNLTTHRYTEGEIRAYVESPESDVFYLKLRDRISGMGMVGAAIVKYAAYQAQIDTFLLSCRAIGRGVEEALLAHVLNTAKGKGCTSVQGHYFISRKNSQVADFYNRQGFRLAAETEQGSEWEMPLDKDHFPSPDWIKTEIDNEAKHANK